MYEVWVKNTSDSYDVVLLTPDFIYAKGLADKIEGVVQYSFLWVKLNYNKVK